MADEADVERNKAVIRKLPALLDSLDPSAPDLPAMKALFTEDFQLHESTRPDWPRGHEGAIRLLIMTKALLPDFKMRVEDMLGEGDKVCVRWRYTGTLTGSFDEMKGDGSRYEAVCFAVYRFHDGRIAEDWGTVARLPDGHPWRTI
jgi:predicted ester cyclase